MTKKKLHTLSFIFADWLAAGLAWGIFYAYRKIEIESVKYANVTFEFDKKFLYGIAVLPLLWVLFYSISGTYNNVYRKSRLREVGQTFLMSLIGVLVIFFTLLLDDTVISYKTYYQTFFTLFALHFFIFN